MLHGSAVLPARRPSAWRKRRIVGRECSDLGGRHLARHVAHLLMKALSGAKRHHLPVEIALVLTGKVRHLRVAGDAVLAMARSALFDDRPFRFSESGACQKRAYQSYAWDHDRHLPCDCSCHHSPDRFVPMRPVLLSPAAMDEPRLSPHMGSGGAVTYRRCQRAGATGPNGFTRRSPSGSGSARRRNRLRRSR